MSREHVYHCNAHADIDVAAVARRETEAAGGAGRRTCSLRVENGPRCSDNAAGQQLR